MSTPLIDLAHDGVSYLPLQSTLQSSISANDLEHRGIRYVRIQWVDLINNIRYRVVPPGVFQKALRTVKAWSFIAQKYSRSRVHHARGGGSGMCLINQMLTTPADNNICPSVFQSSWTMALCFWPIFDQVMSICSWTCKYNGLVRSVRLVRGLDDNLCFEDDLCPRTILRRVTEYES